MKKININSVFLGIGLSVVSTISLSSSVFALTPNQSVFIPGYSYPETWDGGNNSYWDAIVSAGSSKVPFVVLNPNSGSGDAVIDDYKKQIELLESKGIRYIGYVKHDRQNRDIDSLIAEVDRWYSLYPGISGIFFDETSNRNDTAQTCYIANAYNYVKIKHDNDIVVHNPGTRMYDNNIIPYGDVFMTVETTADEYINNDYYDINHQDALDFEKDQANANKIWHVIHDIKSEDQQNRVIELSRERNAGWVYTTSDTINSNPYDNLSDYFNQMTDKVSESQATNLVKGQSVPLPDGCEDRFGLFAKSNPIQPVDSIDDSYQPVVNSSPMTSSHYTDEKSEDYSIQTPDTGSNDDFGVYLAFSAFAISTSVALFIIKRLKN